MDDERKVPIPGWVDCEISESGKVWRNGKLKKAVLALNGYLVILRSENNKTKQRTLHRLLLESFVGPCPDGFEALHINGDRLDNRLSNLRWGTRKENVADAIKHGTFTTGTKNGGAKLTKSDLCEIRSLYKMGKTTQEIGESFGVTKSTIQNFISGRTYAREFI